VSLYCGWIKARQAARADADATARRLLERIEHDPYGFASTLTGDAVQVMHRDGLAAFERQVKARFEAIEPAQQASENAHRRDAAYLRRRWGYRVALIASTISLLYLGFGTPVALACLILLLLRPTQAYITSGGAPSA